MGVPPRHYDSRSLDNHDGRLISHCKEDRKNGAADTLPMTFHYFESTSRPTPGSSVGVTA